MNKKLLIGVIIIVLIIVVIAAVNIFRAKDNSKGKIPEEQLKAINFYEDFNKVETVKNLNNVVWNSVRITQIENKMEVNIQLNNTSKDEKIDATNLTVNLFDKNGKVIFTKNAPMQEIEANYGTTLLNLEFDIEDFVVIYNVQVIANQ